VSYVTNQIAVAHGPAQRLQPFVWPEHEERFFGNPHYAVVLRAAHAGVAEPDV
jgi:hypothetical protein